MGYCGTRFRQQPDFILCRFAQSSSEIGQIVANPDAKGITMGEEDVEGNLESRYCGSASGWSLRMYCISGLGEDVGSGAVEVL